MKAILYIQTEEPRLVKKGEYAGLTIDGRIEPNVCLNHNNFCDYPVFTRHEIEIPEGATDCFYGFNNGSETLSVQRIPIPRPKRKVKKWRWVIADRAGYVYFPDGSYTEAGIKRRFPDEARYHRIDETEKEVDE